MTDKHPLQEDTDRACILIWLLGACLVWGGVLLWWVR